VLDRELMKRILTNLKLRDQAIALSLLSTSQDSGDLFSLTAGWARIQKSRDRFYWSGNRQKTKEPFKTFFSKEATKWVRRCIEQERKEAKDDEPIFLDNRGDPMEPNHLSSIFRDIADKMGIENGNGYQNPLRPKRLRHIFRTACSRAGIDEGYMHAFMGHKSDVSGIYLEKPVQVLELEYSRVEPMLTVFGIGQSEEVRKIRDELAEEKDKRLKLMDDVKYLEMHACMHSERIPRSFYPRQNFAQAS